MASEKEKTCMRQFDLIKAWLSHFSYKPDVMIIVQLDRVSPEAVRISVRWPIRDWRDNQTRRRLICSFVVPEEISTAQRFFHWLDTTVLPIFDRHEHNEFFRIDGVAVFDPHSKHPPGLRSLDEEQLRKAAEL